MMKIYRNTVSDLLWHTLSQLMDFKELDSFRLVGGTSLSLQLGHRESVDIDLFTDSEYSSIDFELIDLHFKKYFNYVDFGFGDNVGMGKSYLIGNSPADTVKVDMFYTDIFQYPISRYENIRLTQLEEIAAMKLDVVGQNGRKKDFWDLHELLNYFSWEEMLGFYEKRYPYGYSKEEITNKLVDFELADSDFDPICLKGKYWELIKLDIEESLEQIS